MRGEEHERNGSQKTYLAFQEEQAPRARCAGAGQSNDLLQLWRAGHAALHLQTLRLLPTPANGSAGHRTYKIIVTFYIDIYKLATSRDADSWTADAAKKGCSLHHPVWSRRDFIKGTLSVATLFAAGCGGSGGGSSPSVEPAVLMGGQGNAPYAALLEKNDSVMTFVSCHSRAWLPREE